MNAGSSEYIPTVVAYKGNDISIGEIAKKNMTKKGYDAYEHFKLRLGQDAQQVIPGKSKTPTEVATDYIRTLLNEYRTNQNISEIDAVVMTVPETWFREASNRTARENIEGILDYCIQAKVKGIICFDMGVTLREGDREYFYQALDRHFPGMKERYQEKYGYSYEVSSSHKKELMQFFNETCEKHGIMHNVGECFNYLREFPQKYEQLSLF